MVKNTNGSNKNDFQKLLSDLNNKDWSVRVNAVFELKNFDDPIVSDALMEKLEDENENLKMQVKQLKKFGEIQVGINSKQARQIRQLVNENEKLNDYVQQISS